MSNGDDDEGEDAPVSPDSFETRLDEAADELEAAETEADLDEVEASLDEIAADLETADLPEPEDEDEESPAEAIESRLGDLRDDLAAARGPYLADVTATLDEAAETIAASEWTESGAEAVVAAVETFLEAAADAVDVSLPEAGADAQAAGDAVAEASEALGELALDPDEDDETIAALLEAASTLDDDLEAAEVWSDLTVREQLDAQGFYDVLEPKNRKDFPPEWNAIKLYAADKEPQPLLTALESFESDFMEENIFDALERFAPAEAVDPLHERAQKRAKHPIRILGRIGDDRVCDTLEDFLGGGDVALEKITLRALGTIGSEGSTQAVANRLDADNPEIRSVAARSLGLIGDPRGIEPLAAVLDDDEADEVRASAAWALNQIGTQSALDAAAAHADDRSYIVQAEAEKATGA